MQRLRDAALELLHRMSMQLSDKLRIAFLISNYSMIVTIFRDRVSPMCDDEREYEQLLQRSIDQFSDIVLDEMLRSLIMFVRKWEPVLERAKASSSGSTEFNFDQGAMRVVATAVSKLVGSLNRASDGVTGQVEQMVRGFSSEYRNIIRRVTDVTRELFSNFSLASTISQSIFKQILMYYQRLQVCLA